ncbi:MAG: peptidase S16 [Proteobacteria bacterium]|nr:peptidase S16 [Pseudomonadota bacterium]
MTDERNQMAENDQTQALDIPLFPLRTVLFPGGALPLRIFEPRYVDMIRWCMREGKGFGVVLLREGSDVLDAKDPDNKAKGAHIYDVGTQAHIIDFDQADNGLLGIVAQGGEKFSVIETDVARDGLMRAEVRLLSEPALPLSERYDPLVSVLRDLLAHPLIQELSPQVDFHEDRSVSHRVADLLPIAPEAKQWLLEMPTPEARLVELQEIIKQLAD